MEVKKKPTLQQILGAICVGAVAVWAVVLRFYGLSQQPFWIDEAYSITLAQAIAQHGYPLLDSGEILWRSPLYHYALAGMIALFGDGAIATRALSVAIGLVAIGAFSYMAWQWFGRRTAVITFIITALSYWEIAWSRQARMYMLLQFLFWASLFAFERWQFVRRQPPTLNQRPISHQSPQSKVVQAKAVHWLLWCGGLTLAAIATHSFGLLLPVVYGLYYFVRWLTQQPRPAWHVAALYTGVVMAVSAGLAGLVHWWSGQETWTDYWGHYFSFLAREYLALLILFGIGVWAAVRRRQEQRVLWLIGVSLIFVALLSYGFPLLHYRYLFMIVPVLILFGAYGISWLSRLQSNQPAWLSILIMAALLVSYSGLAYVPRVQWLLESDPSSSPMAYKSFTPQPPFDELYAIIAQQRPDTLITPYPVMTRLYLQRDDTYALPISVTSGNSPVAEARELYTGVPYLAAAELQTILDSTQTDGSVLILLDTMAKNRLADEWQDMIETEFTELYHGQLSQTGQFATAENVIPWTEVWLYAR